MVKVGSSWVELDYWTSPTWGDYDARVRVLAYSEQNISTNTSKVYFKLQKRVTGGSAYNYSERDFSITCSGHSAAQSWTLGNISNTSWEDVGGDTSDMYWSNVAHASDGTCTISVNASGDRPMSGTFDTDMTITLPTIARASVPTVTPNPITLSASTNTITVATNRKANSFTHDITCAIGSYTNTQTGITDSTTFSIPDSVLSSFSATEKTLDGTITCVTKNGNTTIGTKEITFSAQIDETKEHPNIGTITLTDTNSASAAIETSGTFIKNASNLHAVISLSAVGSYTELASAVVQCGNTQQTYALSGTSQTITFNYNKLDADSLIVTAYDKRGTSRASTRNWTLVPYRDLTVTGSVDRTSETGSTISFTLNGDCFAGSFGNTTNTITVDYKYKLSSATNYTTVSNAFTFTPSGSGETQFTYSNTLTGFDYDKQYNLIFIIRDMFTSATTRVLTLTVGIPVWAYSKDWFGVYGDLHIHDRTDPSQYWTLNPSTDVTTSVTDLTENVTTINSLLEMHNYNWSGSWSNGSSVSRIYEVSGKGLVIINAYVQSSTTSDTGQCTAQINLYNSSNADQGTLSRSGNRVSSSSDHQIAANAATQYYFDGESNINRLRCYLYCTKNGTNSWRIQVTTVGCTLTAL